MIEQKYILRATLTLASGYAFPLTMRDILRYTLEEGLPEGDLLPGAVAAAHGSITLRNEDGAWLPGGRRLGDRTLAGSSILAEISLDGVEYSFMGCFRVSRIESEEGGDSITLSGYDEMLHALSAPFADTLTYPQPLSAIMDEIARQFGGDFLQMGGCNGKVIIRQKPDWGENCTLRRALGWTAAAMGSYASFNRSGLLTVYSAWPKERKATLTAEQAFQLSLSAQAFQLNRVRIVPRGSGDVAPVEAALNDALPADAANTLEISDNALFRPGAAELPRLAQGLLEALSGMSLTPFSGEFACSPLLRVGDRVTVAGLDGAAHESQLLSYRLTLEEEMTVSLACQPDTAGLSLPTVLSASGLLNGGALAEGVITSRHLAAGAVDAEKISARSITAEKLALGTITAESGVIASLSADAITSGKLSTDRLIVGGTEFSLVRALNDLAQAQAQAQADDRLTGALLADRTVSAAKVTDDFGAGLELSSNAAVLLLAGKLDGTHSHLELTESAVNLVGGAVNIATDDMEIRGLEAGEQIMSLSPEGLSAPRIVATQTLHAPNVVERCLTDTAEWRGSIQATLDALPKWLTCDVTILLPVGLYEEDITLRGFHGARLTLDGSAGVYLNGTVTVTHCDDVRLACDARGQFALWPRAAQTPLQAECVQRLTLEKLNISGYRARSTAADGSAYALDIAHANVQVIGCCMEYSAVAAIRCGAGCMAYLCDNLGGRSGSAADTNAHLGDSLLAQQGAQVALSGTRPLAVGGVTADLATVLGTATATPGSGVYAPPGEAVTQTFTPSHHTTYVMNQRRLPDSSYQNLYQGSYGDYSGLSDGWRLGAMWFAGATAALAGKTVRSATLRLRRASGGSSAAVDVNLCTVQLAEESRNSTTHPAHSAPEAVGRLKRESAGEYDVTGLMTAVQAGYGLALFEAPHQYNGGWSADYTQFYGKGSDFEPLLTVTYE